LDPNYPSERLAFMLEDVQAPVLLTQSHVIRKLPEISARILCLDAEMECIEARSGANPGKRVNRENLAYLIYTSGSTGVPKGVAIELRTLTSYVQTAIRMYQISSADVCLQFAPLAFDTSIEEIYPCLIAGGRLVLRTGQTIEAPQDFAEQCIRNHITVLNLPTAYWHE